LTYRFSAYANEMRNAKHILEIKPMLKIFILLKWNKNSPYLRTSVGWAPLTPIWGLLWVER